MAVPNEPLLLPFKEVCRILSVGRTSLYGLIERGELRTIKLGKKRLVPVEEIWRLTGVSKDQANGQG